MPHQPQRVLRPARGQQRVEQRGAQRPRAQAAEARKQVAAQGGGRLMQQPLQQLVGQGGGQVHLYAVGCEDAWYVLQSTVGLVTHGRL